MHYPVVGTAVERKEGRGKVTGQARYVDDLKFPGMIYGATVRSTVPRGRILSISYEGSIPWDEFTIVTADDIPGRNVAALILDDQPYLAETFVNHPEEPILLLAHPDKYLLAEARRHVRIEISPLPPVLTLEDSEAGREIVWGDDNVFKSYEMVKGDVESVWEHAAHIVEGEYRTGAQEQLYIETNGMIAIASPEGGVTVWGSMQCPYYIKKALHSLFPLADEMIRVVQMETGGGFGGKEEYPSMIAGHAALLSWKSGRPVKLIYDRAEDMVATTKRHPSRTRHRTALDADGKLLAMDIEFALDGGAYATLSSVVLSRGAIHAPGPYACPNVRVRAKAYATNVPPHGAFRGFGAPQSIFAMEVHMDKIAHAVRLAPDELRRRNFLHRGDTTASGQEIREPIDLTKLLERALTDTGYQEKRERFGRENEGRTRKKGIGFASFQHGAGFTGSGERYLKSIAGVEATAEGRVRVLASSTEIGQGTNTILCQIAAEALGVPYETVEMARPDTSKVPNSGPTVASRTCMVVGKLVENAATGLKKTLLASGLLQEGDSPERFAEACAAFIADQGPLRCYTQYEAPPGVYWDDEKYMGDAYGAYAWAVYVAEVSVDMATYEVHVDDFVALQEVGRVIHPVLAAGQIEGGVAQAIGYALYEKVVWSEGRMINNQMTNYIVPSSMDLPSIRVMFEEIPYEYGPMGAKGIGELPMDGPAPAILNAIEHACGRAFNSIPLLAEDIQEAFSCVATAEVC